MGRILRSIVADDEFVGQSPLARKTVELRLEESRTVIRAHGDADLHCSAIAKKGRSTQAAFLQAGKCARSLWQCRTLDPQVHSFVRAQAALSPWSPLAD